MFSTWLCFIEINSISRRTQALKIQRGSYISIAAQERSDTRYSWYARMKKKKKSGKKLLPLLSPGRNGSRSRADQRPIVFLCGGAGRQFCSRQRAVREFDFILLRNRRVQTSRRGVYLRSRARPVAATGAAPRYGSLVFPPGAPRSAEPWTRGRVLRVAENAAETAPSVKPDKTGEAVFCSKRPDAPVAQSERSKIEREDRDNPLRVRVYFAITKITAREEERSRDANLYSPPESVAPRNCHA